MTDDPYRWRKKPDGRWTVTCTRCSWSRTGWSQKRLGWATNGHESVHSDDSKETDDAKP